MTEPGQTLVSVVHYCFAILDQSSSCGLGVLVFVNLIVVGWLIKISITG